MVEICRMLGIGDECGGDVTQSKDFPLMLAAIADDLPTSLHWVMFVPNIISLCDDEQQKLWLPVSLCVFKTKEVEKLQRNLRGRLSLMTDDLTNAIIAIFANFLLIRAAMSGLEDDWMLRSNGTRTWEQRTSAGNDGHLPAGITRRCHRR
jgi:hypothetical protein